MIRLDVISRARIELNFSSSLRSGSTEYSSAHLCLHRHRFYVDAGAGPARSFAGLAHDLARPGYFRFDQPVVVLGEAGVIPSSPRISSVSIRPVHVTVPDAWRFSTACR